MGPHKQCDFSHCREVDVQLGVASQHGFTHHQSDTPSPHPPPVGWGGEGGGLAHCHKESDCVWMISNVRIGSFNLNFLNMAIHKQTYTRTLQCSLASVEFAQARPNNTNLMTITTISLWVKLRGHKVVCMLLMLSWKPTGKSSLLC